MAFSSQFALSVELSRVLPLSLMASKAGEAVMSLARNLRNSGSDIVIEEDLAHVFGRCRISRQLESSFKTLVTKSASTTPLVGEIYLQSGPGPTVSRALQQPVYFATVVQLSLLVSAHEKEELGEAMSRAMRSRIEGRSSDDEYRPVPSAEGIVGVLEACEEQTAAFDWSRLLFAVATSLGLPLDEAHNPMSSRMIQALMDMFPAVQAFPEDRFIHIQITSFQCMLVVWAHHVLGLATLVRTESNGDIRFGTGPELVLIEVKKSLKEGTSISLLDSRKGEILLKIERPNGGFAIEAAAKIPLLGYACDEMHSIAWNSFISSKTKDDTKIAVLLEFTWLCSQFLVRLGTEIPIPIDRSRFSKATRMLFNCSDARLDQLYSLFDSDESLVHLHDQPASQIMRRFYKHCEKHWATGKNADGLHLFLIEKLPLVVLLLALCHVVNLESCQNLPLRRIDLHDQDFPVVKELVAFLTEHRRLPKISVGEEDWLLTLALLLAGQKAKEDPWRRHGSLLSARGWSIHVATFGMDEPITTEPDAIVVTRGIPVWDGITKKRVIDGPIHVHTDNGSFALEPSDIKSGNLSHVKVLPLQCGERNGSFTTSIRFASSDPTKPRCLSRLGFRELHRCLWKARPLSHCKHHVKQAQSTVPSSYFAVDSWAQILHDCEFKGYVAIFTGWNSAERWLALGSIGTGDHLTPFFLLSRGCCFKCAAKEAASISSETFILIM